VNPGQNQSLIRNRIEQSIALKSRLLKDEVLLQAISDVSERCIATLQAGKRLLLAGNGGSAADAQHIAAEFVCRFNFDRPGLPAIALATNFSVITAAGNDFSFDDVFAREIDANGQAGDLFIAISTSGNSSNILRAVEHARAKGIYCVGLSGKGGQLQQAADACLNVPSDSTPRIQECHITIGHIICELVENRLFGQE
jgi:D-sedoheptulose 7-phosphate isomerase